MSTVTLDIANIRAKDVVVTDDALAVELVDGRSVTVPLTWFPRLLASIGLILTKIFESRAF
jgi:hypothetical protein